jgi:hypothetical protein
VLFPELESRGFQVHPLIGADLSYQLFLMHLPRQLVSPAARAFISALEEGFQQYTAQYKKYFTR